MTSNLGTTMPDKDCAYCGEVHRRCKGNPAAEREAHESLAPLYKITRETGIPMGSLLHAEGILFRCDKEGLSPEQQRLAIAEALFTAYQNGHKQGRDYQRRLEVKKAERRRTHE
jgi:hypothetical protein